MARRLSPPPLRLWARVLLPWPLALAGAGSVLFLLVLGGAAVPLVGSLADSRLLCFSGALLGGVCALAGGMDGPFWRSWDPLRDLVARLVWVLVLLTGSAAGTALVLGVHGALAAPAISLFLVTWGMAMLAATLLGAMWAAAPALAISVAAMLTAFGPAQWWALGFLLDPQQSAMALTCGVLCCIAGCTAYMLRGTR